METGTATIENLPQMKADETQIKRKPQIDTDETRMKKEAGCAELPSPYLCSIRVHLWLKNHV
jgi:hypothetical protein